MDVIVSLRLGKEQVEKIEKITAVENAVRAKLGYGKTNMSEVIRKIINEAKI